MDDFIKERIREANDIVDVIGEHVPLKRASGRFKACCPFHEEKTPSFSVSPDKQFFYCFGCQASGDVFGFVMKHHGMTFPEALRHLANRAGIQLPEERRRHAPDEVGRDDVFRVNARYAAWYETVLRKRPEGQPGRDYLHARGITTEIAKAFGLGFAPDEWDAAATAEGLRDLDRKHITVAGLAKARHDGSVYDLFRNRVIFPIHNAAGEVVAFGGRTLGDDQAKYINSPETPVYRKGTQLYNLHRARKAVQKQGRAILVEGYVDAIRLAVAGFEEVVATCGTALTPQQAKLLARHTERVLLSYDGDAAGVAAAEKAAGLLFEAGLDVGFVVIPDGGDPDDFIQERGGEAFGRLADDAWDMVDFILPTRVRVADLEIPDRVAYADRMTALAKRIAHPVRRGLYLDKIAERLNVDKQQLQQIKTESDTLHSVSEPVASKAVTLPRLSGRHLEGLHYLLANLDRAADLAGLRGDPILQHPVLAQVLDIVLDAPSAFSSVTALLESLPEELRAVVAQAALDAGDQAFYDDAWIVGHAERRSIDRQRADLQVAIREAEQAGDTERALALMKELQSIVSEWEANKEALQAVEVEQ